MFNIFLTNSADKSQKNLDKPLRIKIKEAIEKISGNPEDSGEKLVSPLSDIYSYHLKYKGREVRIAYGINLEEKIIYIYLIAFHENFYKKLKNIMDA
ncbi:MAG TPA: type II toxin-antitoxin system RelE/ParE family toxin [Candidatus Gastranaerophilales bacterium]|nr:type II toxin-antitoxin system RelE/ParE family toxin [Candidatus Gastranaerophilales bacterium]